MAVCYAQQKTDLLQSTDTHKKLKLTFLSGNESWGQNLNHHLLPFFYKETKVHQKPLFGVVRHSSSGIALKILKYTTFILLNYDWFDLTPRSFLLVNYTPIISFLPTFVHVPANKRCFLAENYTLQIQWKYQVLFVYHVTEPLRILESHVPESPSFRIPEFHVPESHVSVPLLVNHKTAVSIQIFHGLLLVGKPEFWGWSLAEKASLTCFTAAASLYKSNSSAFFNWMSLSYIDFQEFCTHFHYHNLLILNTHKSDFALSIVLVP